jgi:beta-glucosidase
MQLYQYFLLLVQFRIYPITIKTSRVLRYSNMLFNQAHRDLAREAVRKSLVLLKNGKNQSAQLLPLPKKARKILVAGTHADNLGYQCGGWTIKWQGFIGNGDTSGK